MIYLLLVLTFFLGGSIGSFVLVVAERYNTGLSFFVGRSFCFSCNTKLKKKDLFPIFSYIFLKGRCRYCGNKISKQSLFIEVFLGVIAVLLALKFGIFFLNFENINNLFLIIKPILLFVFSLSIVSIATLIAIYDLNHFIIPDRFLSFLFLFSSLYLLILRAPYFLLTSFFHAVLVALPFLIIFLVSRGLWIGLGDIKYIFFIGFLFGLGQGFSVVILSFWIGALFSLIAFVLQKVNHKINLPMFPKNLTIKSEIPFGPFLSLSIILGILFKIEIFKIGNIFNVF